MCENRLMVDQPQVLVIDDETGSRESMAIAIEKSGLTVRTFDDARRALEYLQERPETPLAVCDLRMPDMDGLGFLAAVREKGYELGVILVTGFGSIESTGRESTTSPSLCEKADVSGINSPKPRPRPFLLMPALQARGLPSRQTEPRFR